MMEQEPDQTERPPQAPAQETARRTAVHRMAITAATLAVLLFTFWRCG